MKPILVLLGVLVVLCVAYFATGDLYTSTVDENDSPALAAFKAINFDEVQSLTLAKGKGEPVELRKADGAWVVSSRWDAPADSTKVDGIVDALRDVGATERAGTSESSHKTFAVDKRNGGHITLKSSTGSTLGEVVIGNASGSGGNLVRFGEEIITWSISSDVRSEASFYSDVDSARYLKKSLVQIDDISEVVQVRLKRDGEEDVLVERRREAKKKDAAEETGTEKKDLVSDVEAIASEEYFVVSQGSETHEIRESKDFWKPRGLLDRIKSFSVDDAADPAGADYGLDKPRLQVIISQSKIGDDESPLKSITLNFGNAYKGEDGTDEGYYARLVDGSFDKFVYKVRKTDMEKWDQKVSDLWTPPEPEKTESEESEAGVEGAGAEGATPDGGTPAAGASGDAAPAAGGAAPATSGAAPAVGDPAPAVGDPVDGDSVDGDSVGGDSVDGDSVEGEPKPKVDSAN